MTVNFRDGLAGLVGDYVARKSATEDFHGVLYLNASCPLVRRLAEDAGLAVMPRDWF